MNLLDRLKEFKNTTWNGLDVQEIINLPDEKNTVFMRQLSTPDLDSLIIEIAEYSAWRANVFAEAGRRGMDVEKIKRGPQ